VNSTLVDNQKIATQRLRTNKPGDFFDEIYPIAPGLTQGKAKVTVRFHAHTGSKVGRGFALRMMRADAIAAIAALNPKT